MKIEKIKATPIKIPLPKPLSGSTYTVTSRCTVITQIFTDEGAISEVYNGDNRIAGAEVARIIEEELQPLVVGESVFASELIWSRMFERTHAIRQFPLYMQAIACVDTAVWDLKGKAANLSVCDLVGGNRRELPIFATAGYYQEGTTLDHVREEMAWLKQAGMAGVKFKVGGLTPEEDFKRVEAARDGADNDFFIACDANRAWSINEAIRFAKLVEPLDIAWFEEPCHWHDDARMMSEVRKATSIPINAGQSEITSAGVRRLLANEAVDIVNFDLSHGGGPTEWLRAAAQCRAVDVKMLHHEETPLSAHLLAGMSNGLYVDCFPSAERDPIWNGMLIDRARVDNGMVEIPDKPGFGIELDWKEVNKYKI